MLEYLNNKNIRNILNKNNIRLSDLAESLNKFDDELKKLPAGKAQEFCNALIKKSKFNTISDLDNLTKNINKIDFSLIENMDDKAVRKIAKELGENISTLKTADAINAKITDLKKAASAVNQVLENAKVQELYKRIDIGLSDAELKLKNIKANPSAPNYSGGRVKYYEDTVESIKKFRNEAKNLSEVEYKTVLKFVDNGFDVSSMAKLHNIFEQNAP
jgi:hypothetical protein